MQEAPQEATPAQRRERYLADRCPTCGKICAVGPDGGPYCADGHPLTRCAICGAAPDPTATVNTGGGCDYPTCGDAHHKAVWLALDAAEAAEAAKLPAPPWPVAYPPDWVGDAPATGTVADLEAWVAAHPDAMAAPAQ